MKKLLFFGAMAILMSSCAVHKANVARADVNIPAVETATMATLNVDSKRISYTYVPTKTDAKNLSERQLINNAIYMALSTTNNADVLVKVNYFVTVKKWWLFGRRVKSISVSGYPAYYTDFREPNDTDLKNALSFGELNGKTKSDVPNKPSIFSIFRRKIVE